MDGGVLPQVQSAEVEAEDVDGAAQPGQPVVGQGPRTVAAQRGVDRVELGQQLGRGRVGRPLDPRRGARHRAEHLLGGRAQPGVDAVERPPVGLVGAERRPVARGLGQRGELGGRGDQPVGHRQLDRQPRHLGQVVAQRGLGLPGGGPAQRVGGDERVAVPVAADPRTRSQQRPLEQRHPGPALPQRRAQLRVQRGHHLEQRQLVVAQRLVDLVGQPEPRQPQQRGLPQREHRPPEPGRPLPLVELARRGAVPLAHQLGDLLLHRRDRRAAHLGGVRGDHRAHQRTGQLAGHHLRVEVGLLQQPEGRGEAALLRRRPLAPVVAPAPLVVQVLGEVGQQREVAERPDHVVGAAHVEPGQPLRQLLAVHLRAADAEGLHAGRLDQLQDVVPGLLADHLPEHPAQQPDVLPQGQLVGALGGDVPPARGAQVGGVDGGFRHGRSIDGPCDGRGNGQAAPVQRLTSSPAEPAPVEHAEGSVWDTAAGELLWVDIPNGQVHRARQADGRDHGALRACQGPLRRGQQAPVGAEVRGEVQA